MIAFHQPRAMDNMTGRAEAQTVHWPVSGGQDLEQLSPGLPACVHEAPALLERVVEGGNDIVEVPLLNIQGWLEPEHVRIVQGEGRQDVVFLHKPQHHQAGEVEA